MSAYTLNGYQGDAQRTAAPKESLSAIAVSTLGLAGEAGEVAELIKKHIGHGHPLDRLKLCKELGDVLWYVADLAARFQLTLEEVALTNVEKLRSRYPEGFSQQASINRKAEP